MDQHIPHDEQEQREPAPGAGRSRPAELSYPTSQDHLDLIRFFRILSHERWLVFSAVLMCVFTVTLYVAAAPSEFTAVTQLQIVGQNTKIMREEALIEGLDTSRYMVGTVVDSEVEILKSPRIAERAIRQYNLYPHLRRRENLDLFTRISDGIAELFGKRRPPARKSRPATSGDTGNSSAVPEDSSELVDEVGRLLSGLVVQRKGLTLILLVQYTHSDPEVAAKFANAVSNAYLDEQRDNKLAMGRQAIQKLRERVDALRAEVETADFNVQAYRERSLGERDVKLAELERRSKVATDLYLSLLSRLAEAQAQEDLIFADARIVSPAQIPTWPTAPKKLIPIGLALIGGLGLGILFAVLKDHIWQIIRTPNDARTHLRLPLVASLPVVRTKGRRKFLKDEVLHYKSSPFTQAIFLIKQWITSQKGKEPIVIAVTSSLQGEGRTTIANNLASYASASGLKTLLIDCDLRDPNLTAQLMPFPYRCIVDIVTKEATPEQVITQLPDSGVYLCPGPDHRIPLHPMEILASSELASFLKAAKQTYDWIILDTSPLLSVVDVRALLERVDLALLVVECDRASVTQATEAIQATSLPSNKLGIVLNKYVRAM